MNNPSIAHASTGRLTLADVLRFQRLVVPLGGRRFHVLRGRKFWQPQQWRNGLWKKLDLYALSHHLDQTDYTVSVRWSLSARVKHAVIDLDSPLKGVCADRLFELPELVALADEEMRLNLAAVLSALGHPPHVAFRSSASRGLHVYIFLDRAYDARDVHAVIVDRLDTHGLGPGHGIVDKVFPSNQALRLPLGVDSCLLDDTAAVTSLAAPSPPPKRMPDGTMLYDFGPPPSACPPLVVVGAVERPFPLVTSTVQSYSYLGLGAPPPGPVRLVRDLAASIRVLEKLSKRTVTLDSLRPPQRGVLVMGGGQLLPLSTTARLGASSSVVHRSGWVSIGSASAPGSAGASLASDLAAQLQVPAQKGQRFTQRTSLIVGLYRSGMAKAAAMNQFDGWLKLSATAGTSKQLRGASAQALAAHLKDGSDFWDWLVGQGVMPAPPTARRSIVALSTVAGVPPRSHPSPSSCGPPITSTPRLGWNRAAALAAVTQVDDLRLASISSPWVREKARVLVGLLRAAEQTNGPLAEVSIGARVLDRVVGGRPPPKNVAKQYIDPDTRRPRSARDILLREVDHLGYVRRLDRGIPEKRASLFAVTLP